MIKQENLFEPVPEYNTILSHKIESLKPWRFLDHEASIKYYEGLKVRYPSTNRLPLALRTDCDDVFCYDIEKKCFQIIHDYASTGWEERKIYSDFWTWFREAMEDFIEFQKEEIEFMKENDSKL